MLVFERIVAEQAEMSRSAARRDARQDGDAQAAHAFADAGVEVRRAGGFQFGLAARLQGQSAQSVGDDENDFRGVVFAQIAHQFVHVHVSILPSLRAAHAAQRSKRSMRVRGSEQRHRVQRLNYSIDERFACPSPCAFEVPCMTMELPDEAIAYNYQSLLTPAGEEWTPAAELRSRHFLSPGRLKELMPRLMQCRSQVAAEREMRNVPPEMQPLDAGFIDLPQATLDSHRRKGDASDLGRVLKLATRLREQVDRIVFLGIGGSYLGAAPSSRRCCSRYHNELPPETRLGVPRIYFEGNNADNDALAEPARSTANHLRRSRPARGALGVVTIGKTGDAAGAGRRPAGLSPRGHGILRAALRVADRTVRGRHRRRRASCEACSRRTATRTRTS